MEQYNSHRGTYYIDKKLFNLYKKYCITIKCLNKKAKLRKIYTTKIVELFQFINKTRTYGI